jgi:hypothetical protein
MMSASETPEEDRDPNALDASRSLPARSTFGGFRRSGLVLLGLATLAILACGGLGVWLFRGTELPITTELLTQAERLWEKNGPASYDLEIELQGDSPGKFHVEVRQGRVKTPPTRNGLPVRSRAAWETWAVPGQFETIRRELELAADPQREMHASAGERLVLRGEFDPVYGYPRHYHRIALGGGPEVEWWVRGFKVVEGE